MLAACHNRALRVLAISTPRKVVAATGACQVGLGWILISTNLETRHLHRSASPTKLLSLVRARVRDILRENTSRCEIVAWLRVIALCVVFLGSVVLSQCQVSKDSDARASFEV